jgi:molybdopterin-guanine dinucleotide biosynthesis protein
MRIQRGDKRDRAKRDPFILMRPFIIGIGGAHSKVGKTTIACQILRRLNGWGAIKYSKTSFYSAIVDNPETLQQENKDTSRFINAGAQDVLWVQSPSEGIQEVLQIAIDRLSHVQGIILEGNSAIESLKPEIVIFVSANGEIKRGAEKILSMADAIIFDKDLPTGTPTTAVRLHINDEEEYINFILWRLKLKIKKGHKL